MEDPDYSFWACTQAITDGPDDGPSSRENPNKDFGYIVLNDMANNECYILKEGENTIGRHPLNHIYIEHPSVSMSHAVIQCDSDGVVLLDKGSLNKTRLNKKILKKNVAYFLDENALLIFGEVQANYYVDTVPSEFINVKASNDTLVQRTTGIDRVSVPKLPNTISTPDNLNALETSSSISGANVAVVTENSSACKTETTVLTFIAESDHAKSNDVRSDLNSPSPSDEFLLDAISQIESNEIRLNSPELFQPNENTSSPVMNLAESMPITHMPRIDDDILSVSDIQRLCTEIMPDVTREDTPSPVMDLGPLIDYDNRSSEQKIDNHNVSKTGNSKQDLTQSITTEHVLRIDNTIPLVSDSQGLCTETMAEATREDTPSPVMDLGPLIDYNDSLSAQKNNHCILSSKKSTDKGGELNETQLISVGNNVTENCTQIFPTNNLANSNTKFQVSKSLSDPATLNDKNKSNMLDECTQLPVMSNKDLLSLPLKSININYNSQIEDEKSSDLGTFKKVSSDSINIKIKLNNGNNSTSFTKIASASKKEYITEHNQNIFDDDNDIFISVDQKIESLETQNKNVLQTNKTNNISILNNTESNNSRLNKSERGEMLNNLCENPSTSTYPRSKTETVLPEKSACEQNDNTFEADDDYIFKDFIQKEFHSQSHSSIRKIEKDFSNCPMQRVSLSLNEKETQSLPEISHQCKKTCLDLSNISSTCHSNDSNTVFKTANDDFLNCPTQKVSISKKMNEMKKLSPSIHEQETQPIPNLSTESTKAYPSISTSSSTSKNKDLNSEMDDDDFFNCPTQKVSISETVKKMKKQSLPIHEQETQPIPNLSTESTKGYPSISTSGSTSKKKDSNFEMDDDDFFNCPTQKISISKKMDDMKKQSLSIHEQETQPIPNVSTESTKAYPSISTSTSTSKKKDSNFEMDDDDFFNCPTQKISISKKMDDMKKQSLSIHEQETQPIPNLSTESTKAYPSISTSTSTSKNKDLNSEMDDDDFFNCPTQKVSISETMKKMKKQSLPIHEQETQPIPNVSTESTKAYPSISTSTSTSKKKDSNFEMDDDDFFNCPTQKISISKKMDDMKKQSLSIHEQETQPVPNLSTESTKAYPSISTSTSTSKNKDSNFEMDDDDFFNCPTQKISISKKMDDMKKQSLSIHEQETQPIPNLSTESTKAYPSISTSSSTSKKKDSNFDMDDDDFFNCPTQKISISKKMDDMKKQSLSIHEQETQPIPNLSTESTKAYPSISTSSSTSKSKHLNSEMDDDDFYNCPTQKISISKKMNDMKKQSLSIHEQETQPIPNLSTESTKAYPSISTSSSTSKSKHLNFEMDDDDFYNCPTQKISISKKMNDMKKQSLSIHEQETQPIPNLSTESTKAYPSIPTSSSTCKKKDLNSEMDDDDFFNCPTQKVSISKKMNEIKKLSPSIHDQETQPLHDFSTQPRKTDLVISNTTSSSKSKYLNREIDDEDFFNCPTQKLSISIKKIDDMKKPLISLHEQETQPIPDLPTQPKKVYPGTSILNPTSRNKHLNFEIDDNDFFNYPTQKLSISKKINEMNRLSQSIHEHETQPFQDLPTQPRKTCIGMSTGKSKDLNHEIDNEDFFNCPTQKVSTSKKLNEAKKSSLFIHEQETQPIPDLPSQPTRSCVGMSITNSTIRSKDLNPEINEDFFNCPTQPVPDNSPPSKKDFNNRVISRHQDSTLAPELDEDFFNCPTQPLPDKLLLHTTNTSNFYSRATISHNDLTRDSLDDENGLDHYTQIPLSHEIPSTGNNKQNTLNINETVTQEVSPVEISTVSIVKINTLDKIKQNKENIFNCSTQKSSTKIQLNANKDESEGQAFSNNGTKSNIIQKSKRFCSNDTFDEHELSNQKQSVVSDPMDMNMIRKSSRIHSMSINNQKIKKSITNNKPIIHVRKDLHVTGFNKAVNYPECINKSYQNAGENNIKTSTDNNIVQPSCSKITPDDDSDLILLASIKKELLADESVQHQVKNVYSLRHKNHSKQKNETILSTSNELSTSLSLDQHPNPVAIKSSANVNIVQPRCSKITPDDDSDLILLASIKKELLADESEQHQFEDVHPLRHKDHSKEKNESTFSTSNEPCASTNSPLNQHQNPIPVQSNVDLPNCQPSTSNSSSSQWKSFWNQKKMSNQNKGKSGNQKNTANTNDIVKKERYQTRANTKKDNTEEFNRKRKQDVSIEEGNKRMCKDNMEDRLNPRIQGTSDIVVTFSYLKSRNLLEMKQFVETTGGYVTDEITECTVLVTDKVRCSMKVLSAIAKGYPIVDANWVKHSYTVKMFQDVDEFIISDKDAERKHKFKLKESLARAKAKGLLDGYTVMVTPSVKPSPKDMKVIITCAGGNYVMNWPKKRQPNELIVTCEQDRRRWKPLWDNNKAKTIDNDAFIMAIMRQKLSV